jgi:ankyrin repeat protein
MIDDLKDPFFTLWLWFGFGCIAVRIWNDPYTVLHHAVSYRQLKIVKTLLKWGMNVDTKKAKNMTSLCIAARFGYGDIALLLISYGADVNEGLYEENGWNPLVEAARCNSSEVIEILIAHGAIKNPHFAAIKGDISIIREYLDSGGNINLCYNSNLTLLHLATMNCRYEIVELLLNNHADLNVMAFAEQTPLHIAVCSNNSHLVNLLINFGADIEMLSSGGTALKLAAGLNHREVAEILLANGANPNKKSKASGAPLHSAANKGHTELAKLLLAYGADVNARSNFDGETPLHEASRKGHLEVAELLILNGANVNSRSNFGSTPLSDAQVNQKMISLLQRYGAKDYGSVN